MKTILILTIVIIAAVIFFGIKAAGKHQLMIDYDTQYRILKICIPGCEVNEVNYKKIRLRFEEISKFACKNKEKLAVLEAEFYKRFAQYVEN